MVKMEIYETGFLVSFNYHYYLPFEGFIGLRENGIIQLYSQSFPPYLIA